MVTVAIAEWQTDDGQRVYLRRRGFEFETVKLTPSGRGGTCLPVDRRLARDHVEYAAEHGHVFRGLDDD